MERIADLFGKRSVPPKKRRTERGDLLDWFLSKLNPAREKNGYPPMTISRISFLLARVPTKDIYALASKCRDAERSGFGFSKKFWCEVRPKK